MRLEESIGTSPTTILRASTVSVEPPKVLRPKQRELFTRFQNDALPAVVAALEARESAYAAATDFANRMHLEPQRGT
jgi:hypothetical protein